jgi:iron complex outermembrane receptor protein
MNLTCGFSENYSLVISPFYGDHTGMNVAGFTQVDYRPVDKLKMIAGLRIEQNFLDSEPDRLVPVFRTGINYQPAHYTFLRASFGQGYRYPSIAEKHASTTLGAVTIFPNPYIQPESGWNSEIGLKQGILIAGINGQADLSVFYSQNKDLIEYVFGLYPDPVNESYDFGFQATNIEHSRVYGVESEVMLNHTLGDIHYSLGAGYIFMYPVEFNKVTKRNTDIYLKFRRKQSGKVSLNADYKKFEMGITLYARSKILNIDDVFLSELTRESILPGFYDYWMDDNKGYLIMDGSLGYRINERYTLSLAVKNITNTEYMGRPGDIRPQRSFSLRFSGRF